MVIVDTEGDLNQDGLVNNDDVDIFIACSTGPEIPYIPDALPPGCPLAADSSGIIAADFDRDGDVDMDDFGKLQTLYGTSRPASATLERAAEAAPAQPVPRAPRRVAERTRSPKSSRPQDRIPVLSIADAGIKQNASQDTTPTSTEHGKAARSRQAPVPDKTDPRPEASLGLAFGIVILIIVAILAYLLWGFLSGSSFFGNSTNPGGGTEIQRIQSAITRLNQTGHPDAVRAFTELLGQPKHFNSDVFGGIVVNRQPIGEVTMRATVFKSSKNIAIHETFLQSPDWGDREVRILALLLWAEWQHTDAPHLSEDECQVWLERFMRDIGWDDLLPDLPFHHGTNEQAEN